MSLNMYDNCPCGLGKKIKFCKCHEYLAEMDKIKRMITGEQYVAALDQINLLLKTLPSEPWLLAFKCDVLLRLGEGDTLEETSARFIRLQPDNPLAKLNRAMVALMRGSLEEAATLYLQAIYSPAIEASSLLLTVLSNLIQMLTEYGNPLSAYLHIELASDRFDGIEGFLAQLSARLIENQSLSLLVREGIPSPPPCEDAAFYERFREAIAMMFNGDVPHAKTKLEGIQREFGSHPAILTALLHCKLYLVDSAGAAETCLRLANDTTVAEPQRIYFFALAIELNPLKAGMSAKNRIVEYKIDDEQAFEAMLTGREDVTPLNEETHRNFVQQLTQEEVPPRLVAELKLPVLSEEFASLKPSVAQGLVAIFGKQTDKPARFLLIRTEGILEDCDRGINQVISELGCSSDRVLSEKTNPVPYFAVLNLPITIKNQPKPEDGFSEEKLRAFVRERQISNLMKSKFAAFSGKDFGTAAAEPNLSVECRGILLHYLAGSQSGLDLAAYHDLHKTLGLNVPLLEAGIDGFDFVGAANYYWADLENVSVIELVALSRSAMQRQHIEVFAAYFQALQTKEIPTEIAVEVDLLRRQLALSMTKSPSERIEQLEGFYNALRTAGQAAGQVGIAWFQMLSQLGMHQEASTVIRRVVTENEQDPAVREFVYMMQMQMQQMNQKGSGAMPQNLVQDSLTRRAINQSSSRQLEAESAPDQGSGLWTPDQAAPATKSESGSGLWIPGQ